MTDGTERSAPHGLTLVLGTLLVLIVPLTGVTSAVSVPVMLGGIVGLFYLDRRWSR